MAPAWRSSEEGRRRTSESYEFEVETPSPHRKQTFVGNKRLSVIGGVFFCLAILFFTARRLGPERYTFEEAQDTQDIQDSQEVASPNVAFSTEKVAVIVENRPLVNLVPIILHFSAVLGPEWPIHIFTNEEVQKSLHESSSFQRGLSDSRFQIRLLPPGKTLNTHASVSDFFTKPWFWEQLAPAEHLLLFQADSVICSNSNQKVEDFFQYDFVGAPVDEERGLGMGYNGGLSLRSRSKMLEITNTYDWQTERHGDHSQGNVDYEDQWFSKKLRELPPGPDGSPGANLPSTEVAKKFSVETMWYDRPLGYHQPNVWQAAHMDEVYSWCPEYRMCTKETFTDHNTENFDSPGTRA
jgi:hypothetical protein